MLDITGAYLDLYSTHKNNDEFWWSLMPAFRELEVSIDGKPAGVAWPFPDVQTGGVNPMMWRPITGIDIMNLPSYRINLTPFAGVLGGKHTITIKVLNNDNKWWTSGSLFLYEDGGKPTTGAVTVDTLKFPTSTSETKANLLDKNNTQYDETANTTYQIHGWVANTDGLWESDVKSTAKFSNDQTYDNPGNWQTVHGAQTVKTVSTLVDPHGNTTERDSTNSYTIDCASAFIQADPKHTYPFLLPANLSQSLSQDHTIKQNDQTQFSSSLYKTVQGYGVLQEGTGAAEDLPQKGGTSAYVNYTDSQGNSYVHQVMARGGAVTYENEVNNLK